MDGYGLLFQWSFAMVFDLGGEVDFGGCCSHGF
jgi:hypothetical protein